MFVHWGFLSGIPLLVGVSGLAEVYVQATEAQFAGIRIDLCMELGKEPEQAESEHNLFRGSRT